MVALKITIALATMFGGDSFAANERPEASQNPPHAAWVVQSGQPDANEPNRPIPRCRAADTYWVELQHKGKAVARNWYCSTYWLIAELVTDRCGNPYIFVRRNEGQGSNARDEFLDIAVWNEQALLKVQTVPLIVQQGPAGALALSHAVALPDACAIQVTFKTAMLSDESGRALPQPRPVPKEITVQISYE